MTSRVRPSAAAFRSGHTTWEGMWGMWSLASRTTHRGLPSMRSRGGGEDGRPNYGERRQLLILADCGEQTGVPRRRGG